MGWVLASLGPSSSWAQSSRKPIEILPAISETYLVTRDANIRAGAKNSSKRTGRVKKGERLKVTGRARYSQWYAITGRGKGTRFVYGTVLAPLIDGRLSQDIKGKLSAKGRPKCDFTLQFMGISTIEGELLRTFDYDVTFNCKRRKVSFQFNATMFATEMPYLKITKPIYQINLNLLNVPGGERDVLSVTIMYHRAKKEILFDGLSNPPLGDGRKPEKMPAKTVRDALVGALVMGHAAWGPKLWTHLVKP